VSPASISLKIIEVSLKMDISVKIFMHDKGAEMGTIFNYWYQPINAMKIMKEDGTIDIIVRKKMFIKYNDCNDTKEYDYFSKTNYFITRGLLRYTPCFHGKHFENKIFLTGAATNLGSACKNLGGLGLLVWHQHWNKFSHGFVKK
jgi:hypothetical protein